MIYLDTSRCHLDFMLAASRINVAVISYYDRSLTTIKAMGAALNYSSTQELTILDGPNNRTSYKYSVAGQEYDTYIQPIVVGKEKFYHAISVNKGINKNLLLLVEGQEAESYYDYLMNEFDLPLMREWSKQLFNEAVRLGSIRKGKPTTIPTLIKGRNSITNSLPVSDNRITTQRIDIDDVGVYEVFMSASVLEEQVKSLFSKKSICITNRKQRPLEFTDMDSYFKEYGHTLVNNLKNTIVPLTELSGDVNDFTLKHMRLYPQQIAQTNGHLALLEKSSYAILNHGMGTGKTILAGSICEGHFVRKFLRSNQGKSLKDAYILSDSIKYRNIIMCPGHLVEKWAKELKEQIPYCNTVIINDFSQLLELRNKGARRTHREFYVISKDFGKLTYQSRPSVSKRRYARIMKKECASCGHEYLEAGHTCPKCESREYKLIKTTHKDTGMVCPHCNQILLPYKPAKLANYLDGKDRTSPLDHDDFTSQTEANSKCYYCEADLWEPHVANLGEEEGRKRTKWNRATHYSNKAHKGTKTVWVHEDFMTEYFEKICEAPLNYMDSEERKGSRKYSPILFIKKYMKGFFDIAIFDEAHSYKGGSTGQGHAMHALIKSSKRQLALTGTIAGGYANHLFYLLYRLDPKRLRDKGFRYEDELKFTELYGNLERTFEYGGGDDTEEEFNACCKGRQKGTPKTKPGISPLIFMDFLLDKTTFLDLSDMSKYLPPLIEKVETVKLEGALDDPEISMKNHYKGIIDGLKKAVRDPSVGKGILSNMLQFSLSYLDKPYGAEPIKSPKTGAVIAVPRSYDNFMDYKNQNNLLSKEKRLIEIVMKEIKEGRNCFIFAEYTASAETCVTYRLKAILEQYCGLRGKIEILESSSPAASKREAWIHKRAKDGIKVFITNPRCVETGLDFVFKEDGVLYNYPTLIFYQMGYSLFTLWQASRRHLRLNQVIECRTYYMAVEKTVQEAVIQLIAEKQVATSAIQGKFSTEGLSAMAQGIDVKVKLAKAMADMDSISGNNLQEMFDVLNQDISEDKTYDSYKPMLTLAELLGDAVAALEKNIIELEEDMDIFDMLETFSFENVVEVTSKESGDDIEDFIFGIFDQTDIPVNTYVPSKKSTKKALDGQMDLFGFCS